jgi:predicted transcriptional regulator
MKNRGRFDILGEILEVANERSGTTRTKIMYRAFLSYGQMKGYLTTLTENNLRNYNVDTQTFKTTQKGLRFLDTYNRIGEAMKISSIRQQVKMQGGRVGLLQKEIENS